ncbi:legumain [Aphelenchoides avenae]|nr:legumain [Aphelenchus avenae]
MDACQSGSMFDTLPSDLNIYAVTSASPAENANAVYCPPLNDDTGEVDCPPDDKTLQCVVKQCLAPLFSAAWLHDLEQSQSDETLQAQFESLKEIVAKSPDDGTNQKVSQYGNKGIAKEPIIDFEGKSPTSGRIYTKFEPTGIRSFADISRSGRSSIETHNFLKGFVKAVVGYAYDTEELLHADLTITKLDCHHDSINAFHDKCTQRLPKTQDALRFTGVIGNLCESGFSSERIVAAMDEVCA